MWQGSDKNALAAWDPFLGEAAAEKPWPWSEPLSEPLAGPLFLCVSLRWLRDNMTGGGGSTPTPTPDGDGDGGTSGRGVEGVAVARPSTGAGVSVAVAIAVAMVVLPLSLAYISGSWVQMVAWSLSTWIAPPSPDPDPSPSPCPFDLSSESKVYSCNGVGWVGVEGDKRRGK